MWKIIAVMAATSLDGAVYMMQVGATLRQLTWRKRTGYSLICVMAAVVSTLISYGMAWIFKGSLSIRLQVICASLIFMGMGLLLIAKNVRRKEFEERLDRNFSARTMLRLAVFTNIDTFFVGASFAFLGIPAAMTVLLETVFSFSATFIALSAGYTMGAGYQRPIGISGGCLLMILGAMLMAGSL